MGAWGYGMQENDSACDMIDAIMTFMPRDRRARLAWLLRKKNPMQQAQAVLGLADYVLDRYRRINRRLIPRILKHIDAEIADVSTWKNPSTRRRRLYAFKTKIKALQ